MSKSDTGMTRHQLQVLFDRVKDSTAARNVPGVLGLFSALKATCKYVRTNRTQADIAEDHGVSQPSISRAVSLLTPLIAEVLADMIPGKEDLSTDDVVLIDGTLSPPAGRGRPTPSCTPASTTPPGSTSRSSAP